MTKSMEFSILVEKPWGEQDSRIFSSKNMMVSISLLRKPKPVYDASLLKLQVRLTWPIQQKCRTINVIADFRCRDVHCSHVQCRPTSADTGKIMAAIRTAIFCIRRRSMYMVPINLVTPTPWYSSLEWCFCLFPMSRNIHFRFGCSAISVDVAPYSVEVKFSRVVNGWSINMKNSCILIAVGLL